LPWAGRRSSRLAKASRSGASQQGFDGSYARREKSNGHPMRNRQPDERRATSGQDEVELARIAIATRRDPRGWSGQPLLDTHLHRSWRRPVRRRRPDEDKSSTSFVQTSLMYAKGVICSDCMIRIRQAEIAEPNMRAMSSTRALRDEGALRPCERIGSPDCVSCHMPARPICRRRAARSLLPHSTARSHENASDAERCNDCTRTRRRLAALAIENGTAPFGRGSKLGERSSRARRDPAGGFI